MNAPYKPTHTMRVFLFDSHLLCEGYCATPSLKQIVRDFATMCYKLQAVPSRGRAMIPSNHPSCTALPNHPFYLRCEKSSMFRCNCRIPVNSFGCGNTHAGQTAKPKLNPH